MLNFYKFEKLLRYILLFFLLYLFFKYIDLKNLYSSFTGDILYTIIAVQPIILVWIFLLSIRHSLIIFGDFKYFKQCFYAITLSLGFNIILPFRSSEFLKISFLKEQSGVRFKKILVYTFVERLVEILILISFIPIIFYFNLSLTSILLFVPVSFLFPFLIIFLLKAFINKIFKILKLKQKKNSFNIFLLSLKSELNLVISERKYHSLITLGFLCIVVNFFITILFFTLNVAISFSDLFLIFMSITLLSAIPGLPGGIGVIQAGGVFVLNKVGMTPEYSLMLMIMFQISFYILITPLAFIISFLHGIGIKSIISSSKDKNNNS